MHEGEMNLVRKKTILEGKASRFTLENDGGGKDREDFLRRLHKIQEPGPSVSSAWQKTWINRGAQVPKRDNHAFKRGIQKN